MTFYRLAPEAPEGTLTVRAELSRILADSFNPYSAESVRRAAGNTERADELVTLGDQHGYQTRIALDLPTEPTEAGLQYVLPGCEKDRSRGPAQPDLF